MGLSWAEVGWVVCWEVGPGFRGSLEQGVSLGRRVSLLWCVLAGCPQAAMPLSQQAWKPPGEVPPQELENSRTLVLQDLEVGKRLFWA